MNNKQVPEDIITDAFQISEDLKNGNIHNNRQFVQLSYVKELVASLPAEPSTPETKDKPATGSGGGKFQYALMFDETKAASDQDVDEANQAAWNLNMGSLTIGAEAARKAGFFSGVKWFIENKLATLRQPTGTVYVKELPEVSELDGIINTYVHSYGSETYKHIQEKFWKAMEAIQSLLKPIQFQPEREGVKCEHKYAVLLENGGGAMQCTDCGEVF